MWIVVCRYLWYDNYVCIDMRFQQTNEKENIMKLSFDLKNKKGSFDIDVEKIVDKELERRNKKLDRKTRYQIRQEEKRKNIELQQQLERKRLLQGVLLMGVVVMFILIICTIGASIGM